MSSPDRHRPSGSERVVVAAVVALAVALAVQPMFVSRVPERQTEFTWEMFAKSGPRDEFLVESAGGTTRYSVAELVTPARANTDYTIVLPDHICSTRDGVERVTVLRADEVLAVHDCPT
jgi:hypothetical protein